MGKINEYDLKIRRARAEDYLDILDMGDVFNGMDYLPHLYHKYIADPDFLCFLAEYNGKVVGFMFASIIDEGQGIKTGGGRIHPQFRDNNILHVLRSYVKRVLWKDHPEGMKNYVYTALSDGNDFHVARLGKFPYQFRLLNKEVMLSLQANMENITQVLANIDPTSLPYKSSLSYPSKNEFVRRMMSLSESNRNMLFPNGILHVFLKPLKLVQGNFEKVYKIGVIFWTKLPNSHDASEIRMLSCMKLIPCQAGIRVDHFIFGLESSLVASHVYFALDNIKMAFPDYTESIEYLLYHQPGLVVNRSDLFDPDIKWQQGRFSRYKYHIAVKNNIKTSNL